jgi:STE24 endopeptidase
MSGDMDSPVVVAVLGVLLLALVTVAAVRVPRTGPPPSRMAQRHALAELPDAQVARGRAFAAARRPPFYLSMLVSVGVVAMLGLTPAGARVVETVAGPFGGYWLAAAVLGGLAVVFIVQLAGLPLAAWRHRITVRHGLSEQSWRAWGGDVLKAYAVTAVLGALVLAGFFTVTRLFPQWWPVVAAAGAAAVVVLLSFVFPVLVEPVFNRFTPMPAGGLRDELTALADRDGLPVRDVLVADASRRTRGVNAYVSGLGPTRRIVVYDTLLAQVPPEQVVSVVAHELAHAKHRDVTTGTMLGALGAATVVVAVAVLGGWQPLLGAAGVESVTEPPAVALLLAVVTVVGLAVGPAQAWFSRRIEARADAHALALTGDADAFAAMQAQLAAINLSDPDPPRVEHLLFASHPSTVRRIAAARAHSRKR